MFGQAPRFPLLKPSDTPGPNTYKLAALDATTTGFIGREERFREGKAEPGPTPARSASALGLGVVPPVPSVPAAAATKRRVPSSSSASSLQVTLSKKEHDHLLASYAKLEEKFSRAESKLREANVDRVRLKEEGDGLKRDFRNREAALRARLEKAESGQNEVARKRDAEMARKVEELLAVHKPEKAKWTAKNTSLEADLAAARSRADKDDTARDRKLTLARVEWDDEKLRFSSDLREARTSARRLEKERDEGLKEREEARTRIKGLLARADDLQACLDAGQGRAIASSEEMDTLRALLADASALYGRLSSISVPRTAYEALQTRTHDLEHDLGAARARLLPLRAAEQHQKDLMDRVVALETMLADAEEANTSLRATLQAVNAHNLAPPPRFSSSLLKSADAGDKEAISALAVRASIDEMLSAHLLSTLGDAQHQSLVFSHRMFEADLQVSDLTDQFAALGASTSTMKADLAHAQRESARMSAELAIATRDLESLRDTERDARTSLVSLKEAQASSEGEHMRAVGELRKLAQAAERALEMEKENVRRLASTLGQSKVAEEALRADLEKTQRALAEAQEFEQAYGSQLKENAVLAELNDLAEDEARALAAENAQAMGNQNANQRILYLGRLRSELLDYKQHAVTLSVDLREAEDENARLREELASFRSLDVASKPPTKLMRVSRAPLAASRAANSQRASVSQQGRTSVVRKSVSTAVVREESTEAGDWTQRGTLSLEDLM